MKTLESIALLLISVIPASSFLTRKTVQIEEEDLPWHGIKYRPVSMEKRKKKPLIRPTFEYSPLPTNRKVLGLTHFPCVEKVVEPEVEHSFEEVFSPQTLWQ